MALTDEQKARLEALRTQKTAWADEDLEAADLRELETLEREAAARDLIKKYNTEIGKLGTAWTFVASSKGFVVVRLGASVCYTKLLAAVDSNVNGSMRVEDAQEFILPNLVSPPQEEYLAMCSVLGGLPIVVAPRLAALYRGEREVVAGKL